MRALTLCLVAAGCFQVDAANGKLKCNADPSRACPAGYHCAANGSCWHNGQDPIDDLGIADLAGSDLAGPEDAGAAKHRGDPCSPGDVCETGNCIDGYCCDTACGAACTACNLAGLLGTCSPVPIGTAPVHSTCSTQDVSTCGRDGLCDGAGMCELWPAGTECAPGSCLAGKVTGPSKCNGNGSCVAASMVDCDPYVCRPDGGVCYDSCTDNTQCLNPNPCNTSVTPGSCGPKSLGGTCLAGTDCKSGNCVDGVCCDMAQAACNGCKACNLTGSEGHCANVSVGTDPHNACAGVVCADKCDGAGACRPAPATTVCSNGGCTQLIYGYKDRVNTTSTDLTYCNGTSVGLCNGAHLTACPGSLTCACAPGVACTSAPSCKQACAVDADCTGYGSYCTNSGTCVATLNEGSACTRDSQCKSRSCVSQVCRQCKTNNECLNSICNASHSCVGCSTDQECIAAGWGNACNTATGECSCTASSQCLNASGPTCPGAPSRCGCGGSTFPCYQGYSCAGGSCRAASGQPCLDGAGCASSICTNNLCS